MKKLIIYLDYLIFFSIILYRKKLFNVNPTNDYPESYLHSKLSNLNLVNIYPERYSFNIVEHIQ